MDDRDKRLLKRRRINPGQVALDRERFGLPNYLPPSKATDRSMAEMLAPVMKGLGVEEDFTLQKIARLWTEAVGPQNATHTQPARLERGCLTIHVDHSVWLTEFERFGKKTLFAKLEKAFGKNTITEIRFQLGEI